MAYEPYEAEVSYWGVCWKWGFIPYPCRKKKKKQWCYDFSFLHVSYHLVYTKYWGCAGDTRFSWTDWWPWPLSFGVFTLYFYTHCFDKKLKPDGDCDPSIARERFGLVVKQSDSVEKKIN
jgi:hypothetical protein